MVRLAGRWKYIALTITALVLVVLGLHACRQSLWERWLMGPYTGQPFTAPTLGQPVATMSLPKAAQLEVYDLPDRIVPVLALRRSNGSIMWSRLLVPESAERHRESSAFIRNLRFTKLKRSWRGFRVFIICDWSAGREDGIIYLDRDYSFRSFALSW